MRVIEHVEARAKKAIFFILKSSHEIYYLPFINFCILIRYVESQPLNPDYATEDHGLGTGSRGFPRGSSSTSAPRNNGPLDPSVPYAVPQKKLKSRRSRDELNDPTVGMCERCCCCFFVCCHFLFN